MVPVPARQPSVAPPDGTKLALVANGHFRHVLFGERVVFLYK